MNKEFKSKFPTWCNDNKKYYMCLSDDIDSLFSCLLLNKIKSYKISHFYSFDKMYKADIYKSNKKLCGIDMDLKDGRCWGNHPTGFINPKSANINRIMDINTNNYYEKYAGSTLLQIISYYDINISNLTEEQMMVLLCVDTTFKQYSFNSALSKYYLCDILKLPQLYKLCTEHTQEEFYEILVKYNLHKKIKMNNGKLQTEIDLDGLSKLFNLSFLLPKNEFTLINEYYDIGVNVNNLDKELKKIADENMIVFSSAMTNRNYIKLSYN